MIAKCIRALRTSSSERFILQAKPGEDSAVLDLHYLPTGKVAGTLILFENGQFSESAVPDLLRLIDEVLLPEASMKNHDVYFTVVRGHVVGDFTPDKLTSDR